MRNYKEMYLSLFRETTKVIVALQQAQQQTEEMYLTDDTADNLIVIRPDKISDKNDKEKQPPQG